jgi:hypothetical protein
MARKGVKSYSKERPHLTEKDCSLFFNMGQSFYITYIQGGPIKTELNIFHYEFLLFS